MSKRIQAKSPRGARRVHAFALPELREPPTELQLWNVGDNPTDYGVHIWNQTSLDTAFARYLERGNPLQIDIEHNCGLDEEGNPTDTAGYAALEIRDGAPWLRFDWSQFGAEQIATGNRRFLSPEYDVDPITNEIICIYRVSLVSDPGTYRARVLASAAINEGKNMNFKMLLAALAAALANPDPEQAVAQAQTLCTEMGKFADGESPSDPAADPAATDPTADPGGSAVDAASGDGAPVGDDAKKDGDDAQKQSAIAAAAATAVAPVAAATASDDAAAKAIKAASADAVLAIENQRRDFLLETQGHRLNEGMRKLCSTLPYLQAKAIVDASDDAPAGGGRHVRATRGDKSESASDAELGLQGDDLAFVNSRMGIVNYEAKMPKSGRGGLMLSAIPPSIYRQKKAEEMAAKKAGAK
jgi:hypothetical protein